MNERTAVGVMLLTFSLLLLPARSSALDLFGDPLPQAQTNTCQGYAMMLALAAQGDAAFPIQNFGELRKAEADFRAIAEGIDGGPYGHQALKQAIGQYTGGAYDLEIETVSGDIVARGLGCVGTPTKSLLCPGAATRSLP